MPDDDVENTPDLSISPEKVCYIIENAREFDAKDVVTDPDDGSNPTDDGMVSVLEDHREADGRGNRRCDLRHERG
jgi:hypothetical protein